MKISTQIILFMFILLVFGFASILLSEFLREGSLDLESAKHSLGRADMKVESVIQNIMSFFK